MAKGLALLTGLKGVDPAAYGGWDGRNGCYGCELDVDNMALVLGTAGGFSINTLKTKQATATAILRGIESAASALTAGDMFVFYYSGHGGQQPDRDGDESDGRDETLVAYDRELIDDELAKLWPKFAPGVRIVMISDICNSGTNYRGLRTVRAQTPINIGQIPGMKAQMIHYSGCRDGGTSAGYQQGGSFTMALCEAWGQGKFMGTYQQLYEKIREKIQASGEEQEPQFNVIGPVSPSFLQSRPFSLLEKSLPSPEAILEALHNIPFSVLHRPALAKQAELRLEPLTCAVIGVAVGAALGFASRNKKPSKEDLIALEYAGTIDELMSFSQQVVETARMDDAAYKKIVNAAESTSRFFVVDDVAAASFLGGVVVGAYVVKH